MHTESGVVVVGSMSADITAKAAQLPKRGQTVLGTEFTLVSGGKGSNQAVMSARMGVPTWMVGCVGDDAFRHVVLNSLQSSSVDTTYIRVLDNEHTGIAHIRVDDTGDNDIVVVPLANTKTSPALVDDFFANNSSARVLLCQLEIPLETAFYAAKQAKQRGLTVIFDPAPALVVPDEMYRYVDIVTPNETEARILTGIDVQDVASAGEAAQILRQKGVGTVIITLGDQGVLVLDESGLRHYRAYPAQVVDTTAAGDAFTGALGACLAQGLGLDEAIHYAMAAGSLAVTKMGAQSSLPNRESVESYLAGHRG